VIRRISTIAVLLLALGVAGMPSARAALPLETPADTFQLNGPRVRSVVTVGDNVWIAGRFTQVQDGRGANVASVANLAVFSRTTGGVSSTASPLALAGVANAEVWKLATDGSVVYAAGKFKLTAGGKGYVNLLAFDGTDGSLIASFRPRSVPVSQSVTAGAGLVYAGGRKLAAYEAATGVAATAFVPSTITTDPTFRPGHNTPPQFRALQLIQGHLYSACQCDELTQGGQPRFVKALVRFDPATGEHDQAFSPEGLGFVDGQAGVGATGISVATDGVDLYLGAGGSDFVARYAPAASYLDGAGEARFGAQVWKRDTSGSTQAVEISDEDVIIGGHFVRIADAQGDACGFKSSDPSTLDPDNECIARERLASYNVTGELRPWDPTVRRKYNGVWTITLDGTSVHIGGEFTSVDGQPQTNYARLDGAPPPPPG
jgi:hypothetical protein